MRQAPGRLCFIAALLAGNTAFATEPDVHVKNAWIREAPPVARVQAGYFTACNASGDTLTLLSLSSDRFARVEMHETVELDGVSHMRKLNDVQLAAGECIDFSPGGRHLMLFDAETPAKEGEIVTLVLTFDSGNVSIEFPVRRDNGEPTQHGHHHE